MTRLTALHDKFQPDGIALLSLDSKIKRLKLAWLLPSSHQINAHFLLHSVTILEKDSPKTWRSYDPGMPVPFGVSAGDFISIIGEVIFD